MTTMQGDRRVFLEVKDTASVIRELDLTGSLFVPTRLPLPLGAVFILALRLPRVVRAAEVPMLVLGRRVPRGGSMLSGGVISRPADPDHPILLMLREVAAGRVIDLEARIADQTRTATSTTYLSTADAAADLRALLEGPTQIAVDSRVARDDRAVLTVASHEHGVLVAPHVLVRAVHDASGERLATLELLDDKSRQLVRDFLARVAVGAPTHVAAHTRRA
jgi:hypothetical protein